MNKLTQYDPAVALVDDEEIAVFMADALETGDATYIAKRWAWWHALREWRTSRQKRDYLANNSTARLVRKETRR